VIVRLDAVADRLVLRVEDDGRGIDGADASAPSALGLAGMSERARTLHGTVSVERGAERGTVVTASVPLRAAPIETAGHRDAAGAAP
jgi:signal transduction histidine kinase